MAEKRYHKEDLTVIWKPGLCIHSTNCVKGLPEVFDNTRRPWIKLEEGEKEAIVRQVSNCPSGALSYTLGGETKATIDKDDEIVQIKAIPNGPLQVNASCQVHLANGEIMIKPKKSFFCRCGNSSNKPFCDGSHKKAGFTD